jgi:hypothetical protein
MDDRSNPFRYRRRSIGRGKKRFGIILDFLLKEGASDNVQTLLDRLSGADAAVRRRALVMTPGGILSGMYSAALWVLVAG